MSVVALPDTDTNPGYLVLASFYSPDTSVVSEYGPQIVDKNGQTVWFQPLPRATGATLFRVQEYQGKPVLTWWEGTVVTAGCGEGQVRPPRHDLQADQDGGRVGRGLQADLHEFLLTPEGTALITAYNPVTADLSPIGGPNPGTVLDSIVQEVDVASGRVLFEWHSWGPIGLSESKAFLPPPGDPYDHFHVNSIDVDRDGDLLVSRAEHVHRVQARPPVEGEDHLATSAATRATSPSTTARNSPGSTTSAGAPTARSRCSTTAPTAFPDRRSSASRAASSSTST